MVQRTLNKGKGICGDYSILFKRICELLHIDSRVVYGYAKNSTRYIGTKFGEKHAWNSVFLNGEWKLIDVTWAAGMSDMDREIYTPNFNSFYFLTNPQKFAYNHYPKDKTWLLTDITKEDFACYPLFTSYYLSSDLEIVEPQNGVIIVSKKDKILFTIKNISKSDAIEYRYKSQKLNTFVKPSFKGDYCSFEISPSHRRVDYLHLFVEYKCVAIYKLIVR